MMGVSACCQEAGGERSGRLAGGGSRRKRTACSTRWAMPYRFQSSLNCRR